MSNLCHAGFPLPPKGKPCPECGAKLGDTCGRVGRILSKEAHERDALRAELAQARADIAERDALLAVVAGVLDEALPLVEEYSCRTPVGHMATDCEAVVARGRYALAALPAQAKALLTLAEAAKNHVANKNVQWAVSGVPTFIALADALSTLSRPDGDGR